MYAKGLDVEKDYKKAATYGLYNVLSLGGTVHCGFYEDIEGLAATKICAMAGLGLFNLSKGSREEREQARQDALTIRAGIHAYRAFWRY